MYDVKKLIVGLAQEYRLKVVRDDVRFIRLKRKLPVTRITIIIKDLDKIVIHRYEQYKPSLIMSVNLYHTDSIGYIRELFV